MVNKLFEKEVEAAVGKDVYPKLKETEAYRSALKTFDMALKPAFRGADDRDKYISFPMASLKNDRLRGIVNDTMTLTG